MEEHVKQTMIVTLIAEQLEEHVLQELQRGLEHAIVVLTYMSVEIAPCQVHAQLTSSLDDQGAQKEASPKNCAILIGPRLNVSFKLVDCTINDQF